MLRAAVLWGSAAAFSHAFTVEGVEILFTGDRPFAELVLVGWVRPEIRRYVASGYRESEIADAAFLLQVRLRKRGYSEARVDGRVRGKRLVRFSIRAGRRVVVREIRLAGITPHERRLAGQFLERARVLKTGPLNDAGVQQLVEATRNFFKGRGHLDPAVRTSVAPRPSGGGFFLDVTIAAGVRTHLAEIGLAGNRRFPGAQLVRATGAVIGGRYDRARLPEWRSRVADVYRRAGYARAEIVWTERLSADRGWARLTGRVSEGARYRIGKVGFRGNRVTSASFLRRFLDVASGRTYDLGSVSSSEKNLERLGLFTFLRREEDARRGTADLLDLTWVVEEKDFKFFSVHAGYNQFDLAIAGVNAGIENLLGQGLRVGIRGEGSFKRLSGEVYATAPNHIGRWGSFESAFFVDKRLRPAFEEVRYGYRGAYATPLVERFSLNLEYRYYRSDLREVEGELVLEQEGEDLDISRLVARLEYDMRDDRFLPVKGGLFAIELGFSGGVLGADLDAYRFGASASWYQKVGRTKGRPIVLALGARLLAIFPFGGKTPRIPIQERLFLGGQDSIRSFDEDEAGPTGSLGTPVGGELSLFGSAELRIPIHGNFHGALFADAGVAERFRDDFLTQEFDYALGVGVRYHTPLGPLRLDAALNPDRRGGEDFGRIWFTVGFSF